MKRKAIKVSIRRKSPKSGISRTATAPGNGRRTNTPSILRRRIPTIQTQPSANDDHNGLDDDIDHLLSDLPSDIILAMTSLKQRHSFATCNILSGHDEPIPFILKRMIAMSLWSTCKNNPEVNQVASAEASTGFNIELHRLCNQGDLKLIQLQGLNGEEDIAVFHMGDYIRGIRDTQQAAQGHQHDTQIIGLFLLDVEKGLGIWSYL